MPAFSGSSLERDSRAAGAALFSLRIDQGNKGREIIGCIVTVLVKMLSFDNTLGPMIRLTMLTLLEIREPKYDRESSTKELRGGEGMLWFPLHNDKRIDKFLSFKRNRWQRPQAEKEVQNHLGCGVSVKE